MDILKLRKHITLTSPPAITEICAPLKKLEITHFNYVRTFSDGSQISLSDNGPWLEHFYTKEYYKIGEFEKHPINYESGHTLWPTLSGREVFYDARTYFDIDHGITLVEKLSDSCEFCFFATASKNPQIVNFYLNNIDLLKRFVLYFKEKAAPILAEAQNDRLIIPQHFIKQKIAASSSVRDEFLTLTMLEKYKINFDSKVIELSRRELECSICLLEGLTAEQTGKKLFISRRTVEAHLDGLKSKLFCKNKHELVSKLIRGGLGMFINTHSILTCTK